MDMIEKEKKLYYVLMYLLRRKNFINYVRSENLSEKLSEIRAIFREGANLLFFDCIDDQYKNMVAIDNVLDLFTSDAHMMNLFLDFIKNCDRKGVLKSIPLDQLIKMCDISYFEENHVRGEQHHARREQQVEITIRSSEVYKINKKLSLIYECLDQLIDHGMENFQTCYKLKYIHNQSHYGYDRHVLKNYFNKICFYSFLNILDDKFNGDDIMVKSAIY